MFKLFVLYLLIALISGSPPKERFDKATIDDVGVNVVAPNKVEHIPVIAVHGIGVGTPVQSDAAVNIQVPEVSSAPKPTHSGPTFTRLIEDIFQIPITILQAVSNLITNPFRANKKSPETTVPTY